MQQITFTSAPVVRGSHKGESELFAPHSFTEAHPGILPHVFSVPDEVFYGPDFARYAEQRIEDMQKTCDFCEQDK